MTKKNSVWIAFKVAVLFITLILGDAVRADTAFQTMQSSPGRKARLSNVGPDTRSWIVESDSLGVAPASQTLLANSGSVLEMESGMNYWDGRQWTPSDASFEMINKSFVAAKLQHPVTLNGNLNVVGAVKLTTPKGHILSSTPVGIALLDPVTGDGTLIASVKDCDGVLVSNNVVLYENAFEGVSADVVYTIEKGAFSQDVVITGKLNPEDWGFSTNAQIQLITEFYKTPEPNQVKRPIRIEQDQHVRNQMAKPDFVDSIVDFGDFVLGQGKAYAWIDTNGLGAEALVAKEYVKTQGRHFLVESLNYSDLQEALQTLPVQNDGQKQDGALNNLPRKLPIKKAYSSITSPGTQPKKNLQAEKLDKVKPKKVAFNTKHSKVVIDYVGTIGSTSSSITFTNGATYYVSGAVNLSGPVTIEGGAIFKYKANASITMNYSVVCKTGPYNPAIFTAYGDDSVGECVTNLGGAYGLPIGTNGYANPALTISYPNYASINNLRFCYCKQAIAYSVYASSSSIPFKIIDSQLVNCIQGISITVSLAGCGNGCGQSGGVNVYNSLFDNVQSVTSPSPGGYSIAYANFNHCTISKPQKISQCTCGTTINLNFTNSILANVATLYSGVVPTFSGVSNGFYNCQQFGSGIISSASNPFQSNAVGAGAYYLASGSAFIDKGFTNIDSIALSSITNKTCFAPTILTNTVATNLVLTPCVPKDTQNAPDLGYHYDPIDYIANVFAVTNATLTITNGTTIACYWGTGIWLQDGAKLICQGLPKAPNRFIDYLTVQEQPVIIGTNSSLFVSPYRYSSVGQPMSIRFTQFRRIKGAPWSSGMYSLYCDGGHYAYSSVNVADCLFSGGGTEALTLASGFGLTVKNTLFDQDTVSALGGFGTFYNNLNRSGGLSFNLDTGSIVRNNAFDGTIVTNLGMSMPVHDHNAYINSSSSGFPTNAGDVVLTNLTYASGPLGYFYQSSSNLVDKGSWTADQAGLYHYTTRTNLVKETNSIVDIGLHFVSTDGTGNPVDIDGDGIADYLEDLNGDGIYEAGETDWTNPSMTDVLLGHWRFDTTNFVGDQGQLPLYPVTNVVCVPSWSSNAAWLDSSKGTGNAIAHLSYHDVETNGTQNIDCRSGTVSFWFKPDWSGISYPGNPGRLIEMGDTNSTDGWWSLWVDPRVPQLSFQSKSNNI